jgi:hypothetical protein
MPALTPAQEEAYAYVRPSDLWLIGVILEHEMLPAPLRFVDGVDEDTTLVPKNGETPVLFKATAFSFKAPAAAVKEGPGEGELQVDGVSGDLRDAARWAGVNGLPVECTILIWRIRMVGGAPDFIISPHQRYEGLRIEKINVIATSASATLKVRDWGTTNFPRMLFSRELYPALHG